MRPSLGQGEVPRTDVTSRGPLCRLCSGRPSRFACCTDLGAEWNTWTGRPAVFATWVIRRTVAEQARAQLTAAIDAALTRGLANLDAIAARRRDTGIGDAEVVSYLTNFIYRFGPEEAGAIDEFTRR